MYNFRNLIYGVAATVFFPSCQTGLYKRASPNDCKIYVIVPPESIDETASDLTATTWIHSHEKRLPKCHRIVSFGKSKSAFQLLNVNYNQPLSLKEFGENPREKLFEKTKATSIVFLNPKFIKNKIIYNPKVYSLVQLEEEKPAMFRSSEIEVNKNARSRMKPSYFASMAANLVPNSMTLGISSANYENHREVNGEIERVSVHELSPLPKILTGFSATNISHPDGFNTWDFDSRWFGALTFEGVNNRYTYRRPSKSQNTELNPTFNYDLKIYVVSPTLNRDFSVYSLLGTTYVTIGIGPGFYTYTDSLPTRRQGTIIVIPFSFGHRTFLTEKIFTQFSVNYISQAPPIVDNEVFKYNGSVSVWLGFGYFFPEGRTMARNVF